MILRTLCLILTCLVFPCIAAQAEPDRPNILFFLIDDQRDDTLGCAGHPIVKTPEIDRLAASGVHFTNAFVTTSICAASRASILTGLYERNHGFTFGTPPIDAGDIARSYPVVLRRHGYRTGLIGKYGVASAGKLEDEMFDYFEPIGTNPYFKQQPDGSLRHETDLIADSVIEFLKTADPDQPFCLSVNFNAAHAEDSDLVNHYPWPPSADGLYEDVAIPAPRLSASGIFDALPGFLKTSMNRQRYYWRWDTPDKYERNMRAYFRMISGIDASIKRIRDTLRELGREENTVIIYLADNGYYMGDRGFAGKWSHYEQSLRVPLIIFDPRAAPENSGIRKEELALNIDVTATILDLAGAGIPPEYQGSSLLPLLMNAREGEWREDFLCEHLMDHKDIPKWEGVRDQRYVYARYFEQEPAYEFLHDLKVDPDQLVNLAESEPYSAILQQMRNRCDELIEENRRPIPGAASFYSESTKP